jgi:hypothetical protein
MIHSYLVYVPVMFPTDGIACGEQGEIRLHLQSPLVPVAVGGGRRNVGKESKSKV